MVSAASSPGRDRVAIVTSIALHCCVLAAFVAAPPRSSVSLNDLDERTLLARIIHVERRPAPPVRRTVSGARHVATTTVTPRPFLPPVMHAAVAVEHSARALVVARETRAGAVAERAHAPARPRPVERVAPETAPTAAAESASASPPPSPSPAPSAVAQRDEGIGNFGESYPASLEPAARGTLLAGMAGFDVRVAVDESGRATAVDFVRGPTDPALRDELRTRLLAARFTPASCNGLRCAGSVELKS